MKLSAIIATRSLCFMQANFPAVEFLGKIYPSDIQKSVMHVQSFFFFFAYLNQLLFDVLVAVAVVAS